MDSNFTFTLVSELGDGGQFYNTCNEILDFETHPYEVCVLEIFFHVGAWDNVREGANQIKYMQDYKDRTTLVKPGNYDNHHDLLVAIHHAMTGTAHGGFKLLDTKAEWLKNKLGDWEARKKEQ